VTDARVVTQDHITRVRELLAEFTGLLISRGRDHDASKFDPVEAGPLQEMQDLIDREGPAPYGTDEYRRRTALLGPMLAHHYACNSHHPEHFPDGVAGMNLLDLVEMFFDWRAASERGSETSMNLSYSVKKYDIPPMLEAILRNTARTFGFEVR
jgi:hypothetical protein